MLVKMTDFLCCFCYKENKETRIGDCLLFKSLMRYVFYAIVNAFKYLLASASEG